MGMIINVKCDKCHIDSSYNLGQGFRDGTIENVLLNFSGDNREIVRQKMEENQGWDYEKVLSFCNSCRKMQATSVLSVNGEHIIEKCECGGESMILLGSEAIHEDRKINCPICGEELVWAKIGLWD